MLRIPLFRTLDNNITVYQDDAIWHRFYLMPSLPTIRRDESQRPIFLLSIFHTPDELRAATPTLPRGGGFMNFDVQFAVEPSAQRTAEAELQKWVNDEYVRRRADARYSALPEYAAATAPKVQVAEPTLSGGKVSMHTTQSAQLVTARFAEGPASLVSGSTAVFNVDLTETGASFMHDLFVDRAGTGRIDLSPVQVIYDLKMWARLPPISIRVTGNSERIHQTLTKLSETTRDNVCTPAEVETYRQNGTNSSTLKETGLVEVKIDKGDATVPDDIVQALQQYALDLFDTMVEERFLMPADDAAEPLEFDSPLPAAVPNRRGPIGRYKVRETVNHSTMNLEIVLDRSQVVEWPTGGQATLETFFAGASAADLKRHVVEITSDQFNTLGVTVRALVDFDKSAIQAVTVQTEYTATDRDGRTRTTPGAFTFRSGETAAGSFDPTVINNKREYRYRYAVIFDDGSKTDFTEWETTTLRALNIAVQDPGKLALEVSAASLNWDVLRAIQVDLSHGDGAAGGRPLATSFELTKLNPTRKWEQQSTTALRGAINGKITYFLADDKVLEGDPHSIAVTNSLFMVPPPQVDVLNVTLVPAGDWSDVGQMVVTMQYDAGQGRVFDRTFKLSKIEDWAEWTVLLRDPNQRTFRYKTITTFKSGADDQKPWTTLTGDQAIALRVTGPPRLKVNVLAALVDFERTPAVTVTLVHGDERNTLSFTAKGSAVWNVPLRADGNREYTYTVTYHPTDGAPVTSGPHRTLETELFIQRAQLPTIGKLDVVLRGFAVDFTATPFVDVALVWRDGDREERKTITLSKEASNATWSVPIGDRTQRKYQYAITYNLADGTRAPGAHGETDDPVLSVTKHQP
jgi:hypothetical protein